MTATTAEKHPKATEILVTCVVEVKRQRGVNKIELKSPRNQKLEAETTKTVRKTRAYIGVLCAQKLGQISAATDCGERANQSPPRVEERPRTHADLVDRRLRCSDLAADARRESDERKHWRLRQCFHVILFLKQPIRQQYSIHTQNYCVWVIITVLM